eukprot:g76869.t1
MYDDEALEWAQEEAARRQKLQAHKAPHAEAKQQQKPRVSRSLSAALAQAVLAPLPTQTTANISPGAATQSPPLHIKPSSPVGQEDKGDPSHAANPRTPNVTPGQPTSPLGQPHKVPLYA